MERISHGIPRVKFRSFMDWKGFVFRRLYSHWKPVTSTKAGYSIIMPMPEDMPFLMRLAIEGLKCIDTSNCKQFIVVGDGYSNDHCSALKRELQRYGETSIGFCELPFLHRMVARRISCPHPISIIFGASINRCDFAFLHDADAFFLDRDSIESTFEYCTGNEMDVVGVTARWDPFFQRLGYAIPGTWQMMFRTAWLRDHPPFQVIGRKEQTPHGMNTFDTLLYPQYLDYGCGRIGVMPNPPRYVHFNGTIVTYRAWRRAKGRPVVDELFRLLLLSILEHILPATDGKRLMPRVDDLARGLKDSTNPIRYDTLDCVRNYAEFRDQIKELCRSPVFAGERAATIKSLLIPFDTHFARIVLELGDKLDSPVRKFRQNGLA